jgi:hypothetical protein
MAEAEKIMNVVEQFDIDEVLFADTEEQKKCFMENAQKCCQKL